MLAVDETVFAAKDQLMKSLKWLILLPLVYTHSSTTPITTPDSSPLPISRKCYYDPFYRLRPTPLPVCSVLPAAHSSTEPTPELLSFEEWKQARLLAETTDAFGNTNGSGEAFVRNRTGDSSTDGRSAGEYSESDFSSTHEKSNQIHKARMESRVPLTDRFNYAALDCTARIHSAHKESKSPLSILSHKKDKYMLSPCASRDRFVVVELCDDIRIDTVQLANFEFFSAVFKDLKISLAETIPSGWIDAGIYRAKNVRGVQSFHPPQGRLKFYRYIRIDFLSHYGSEFYCPLSLLRVYGLNHMEDYKWESWQTEGIQAVVPEPQRVEEVIEPQQVATQTIPDASSSEQVAADGDETGSPSPTVGDAEGDESQPMHSQIPTVSSAELMVVEDKAVPVVDIPVTVLSPSGIISNEPTTAAIATSHTITSVPIVPSDTSVISSSLAASTVSSSPPVASETAPIDPPSQASTHTRSPASSSSASVVQASGASVSFGSAPPPSSSGESIYRTIMNRLHILEINGTLSIRYVEEQTRSVREVVRRLEEDVGRLEGMGKRQQLLLERAMAEMEKQRSQMDLEMKKVLVEVQTLSKEVTLEKRLGLLQLCLLMFVFVFIALTRGSRETPGFVASGVEPQRRSRLSRLASWSSADWAKWRQTDRDSGDLSAPQTPQVSRNRTRPPPLTPRMQSPNSGWSSSAPVTSPSPLSGKIAFIPDNSESRVPFGGAGTNASQQSHTYTPRHSTTPKHRTRVISSPLPVKPGRTQTHSHSGSAPSIQANYRRLAPHLHEVKARRSKSKEKPSSKKKTEFVTDGRHEDDEQVPSDGEGTPRVNRAGFGFGLGMMGVGGTAASGSVRGKVVSWKEQEGEEQMQAEFVRESSPLSEASTAATDTVNDSDADSASGLWEDTSTDDDVDEQVTVNEAGQSGTRFGNWAVSVSG